MKWATPVRILRGAAVTVFVLFLLLGAFLRIQTYLFRRQAEHLMADFQALKLRQTKWPEAESLTRKWGKYGHYQGDCNASFCRYTIDLLSPEITMAQRLPHGEWENSPITLAVSYIFIPFRFLARPATLRTTFVVQDAIVARKSAVFSYQVPSFHLYDGLALIVTSRATSRLSSDEYLLTYGDQLAKHPYYTYSRPGGCTFCHMANVSFTPDTPESEMRWLTTFNLACLTNLTPCRYIEDIYPASEGWHLYDWARSATANQEHTKVTVLPVECRIFNFRSRSRSGSDIQRNFLKGISGAATN